MKKSIIFLWIVASSCGGFILGMSQGKPEEICPVSIPVKPEKALVTVEEIQGDILNLKLKGNVRVIWSEEHFLDESGALFLGQVPNASDLQFSRYPFVGNANTGKFYPSTTTWARGVRVKDRRFFATKNEAISAGFIPSKSVK